MSQNDYEEVTKSVIESFELSQSSTSQPLLMKRNDVRRIGETGSWLCDFVALIMNGKYLSKYNIVISSGITITGIKIPPGFIQTTTDNSQAEEGQPKNLIERNFNFEEGLLTITSDRKVGRWQ